MKYSKDDLSTLRSLNIIEVATRLGIKVHRQGASCTCCCFLHADSRPSMSLVEKTGKHYWHCFVCNKGGDTVSLVRLYNGLGFIEACDWLCQEFGITPRGFHYGGRGLLGCKGSEVPSAITCNDGGASSAVASKSSEAQIEGSPAAYSGMLNEYLQRSQSMCSMFCKSVVSRRILSYQQMRHAAARYHLGATRDEGVIFWQVDRWQQVLDGKIMYYQPDGHRNRSEAFHPRWTVALLKKRRVVAADYSPRRCLFGEHLLERESGEKPVAVVESEKTAVICSELFPNYVWVASGGFSCLSAERFVPLKGRKVVVFPDTDPEGKSFAAWSAVVAEAQRLLSQTIYISNLLETCASAEQKARKIDIVDFFLA